MTVRIAIRRAVCAASFVVSSVSGCSSGTASEWVRDFGTLDPSLSSFPAVSGPSTARVGAPFTIVVTTVGSADCVQASGATVRVHASVINVVPMDERYVGARSCRDIQLAFPREVSITLMTPGETTINVIGYSARSPGMVTIIHPVRVDP